MNKKRHIYSNLLVFQCIGMINISVKKIIIIGPRFNRQNDTFIHTKSYDSWHSQEFFSALFPPRNIWPRNEKCENVLKEECLEKRRILLWLATSKNYILLKLSLWAHKNIFLNVNRIYQEKYSAPIKCSRFHRNDLLERDDVNKFDLISNPSFSFSREKVENRFPNEFELFSFGFHRLDLAHSLS